VGIEVAHRAVDLAADLDLVELAALAAQAKDHVGQFLAQGGWGGGLAMGSREHRQLGMIGASAAGARRAGQQRVELFDHWPADDQRPGQVVDVLGGAGEVHELQCRAPGRGARPVAA
jgi:hypothetical protein